MQERPPIENLAIQWDGCHFGDSVGPHETNA